MPGKTATQAVPLGPERDKVQREVANYKRFKAVVEQIVEVNGKICKVQPLTDSIPVVRDD